MKKKPIKKAMILCAGLGTRLLPVTESAPKPLVPVLNVANIVYNLLMLKQAGISEVMVNLHHLPEKMMEFLGDGSQWNMRINFSREKVLLGTGGGVKKAAVFFEGESFVLCNCDFVTNIDLNPLIQRYFETEALATMVLVENEKLQPFYSRVGVSEAGHLCQLPSCQTSEPARTGIFTGIHILDSEVLEHLRPEFSGINQILYPRLMKEKPAQTRGEFVPDVYWRDTGDLDAYWVSSMELLKELFLEGSLIREILSSQGFHELSQGIWSLEKKIPDSLKLTPPVVLGKQCHFESGVELGPYAVIGNDSSIQEGVRIEEAIVLPNGSVEKGKQLKQGIVFGNVVLPAHRKTV